MKRTGIANSPYGYGLYFRSDTTVTMSILHNFTLNKFLQKINQRIHCVDCFIVIVIDYFHPVRVVNIKLIHYTVGIKSDNDIV